MKKVCVVLAGLCIVQLAGAVADIGYSNDDAGYWAYTPSIISGQGIFSFIQPIGVDNVQGLTTDPLVNGFLHIPGLAVSNLIQVYPGIYQGIVTPVSPLIALKDGVGADILTGLLASGGVMTVGSAGAFYPTVQIDIIITSLQNAIGSPFIDTLKVGYGFNFDLTLQDSSLDMASMILTNKTVQQGSTLSGSMVTIIPEPATMVLLCLGSVLLRKQK